MCSVVLFDSALKKGSGDALQIYVSFRFDGGGRTPRILRRVFVLYMCMRVMCLEIYATSLKAGRFVMKPQPTAFQFSSTA